MISDNRNTCIDSRRTQRLNKIIFYSTFVITVAVIVLLSIETWKKLITLFNRLNKIISIFKKKYKLSRV